MVWWCSVQFSSVAQSCLTPCDPMHCSTPGLPVHHQPPEFTQTHVHWVGDAIQPSHPLSPPSPPALSLSQHRGLFHQLFASGGQGIGVSASTSVLPVSTQDWSPLEWTGWISLQSKGLSSLMQHHCSKASIFQRLAFFTVQLSHPYVTTGKTITLTRRTFDWSDGSQSKWKGPWIRSLIKVTGRSREREGYGWRTRCLK